MFASFSAFRMREVTLTEAGEGRLAHAATVTPEFFDTSFVYGVTSADPLTYVGVCLGVWLLALLAALVGARAAMSVDPSHTLTRA